MRARPRLPDDGVNLPRTHPLKEALLIGALVVGVGVAILVVLAWSVELLAPMVPVEAEVSLLAGLAEPLESAVSLEHEHEARVVRRLVERLADHWPDNPYVFRVAVIDETVPNAFAVPGGLVLVTSGLLEHVGSENELAFVLAHELGHFRNRDHITTLGRSLVVSLALGSVDIDTSGLSLFGTTGLLTERSFGRDDEREADRFGLALLYAEYGHIGGAADFLHSMAQGHAWSSNMLGTHPFGPDRARELQALAREEGWPADGPRQPVAWPR